MDKLNFEIFRDPYNRPLAEIIVNGQKLTELLHELGSKLDPSLSEYGYSGLALDRLLMRELTSDKRRIPILSDDDCYDWDYPVVTCNVTKTENTVIWSNIRNGRKLYPPIPVELKMKSLLIYEDGSEERKKIEAALNYAYAKAKPLIFENLQFEFDKEQYKEAIKELIYICLKEYGNFELWEKRQAKFEEMSKVASHRVEFSEDFLDKRRKKHYWKPEDSLVYQWNKQRREHVDCITYDVFGERIWDYDDLINKWIEHHWKNEDCFVNQWNEQPDENDLEFLYNWLIS
jgi:hypothetical protein